MKRIIALALAATLSTGALAQDSLNAIVDQANCVQVGQNTSLTGGAVGGALGGVGGALVGSMFGKKGKTLGAIAGAVGGAAIGASGSKIYNCSILTRVGNEQVMVQKQSEGLIERGHTVTLVKQGGVWQAL